MEGDPHIKSKRRQLHQEMSTQSMLQNVRKATVVVANPTHRAVALFYDKEKTKLPVTVAKGENILAERIQQIAREEGIPIMRDIFLARELYEKGQLDGYIPADLIEPVAEVLRWVYRLKGEARS
jgi:type III secretion protein U